MESAPESLSAIRTWRLDLKVSVIGWAFCELGHLSCSSVTLGYSLTIQGGLAVLIELGLGAEVRKIPARNRGYETLTHEGEHAVFVYVVR
jgi:hypothetical protein